MSKQTLIKFLTIILFHGIIFEIFSAEIITQENSKTHLRWNIFTNKENVVVEKSGATVSIKTLNSQFFERFKQSASKINTKGSYIKSIQFLPPTNEDNVSEIKISLIDNSVELFSFYRSREKKYIFDFWKDLEDDSKISTIDKKDIKKSAKRSISAKKKISHEIAKETINSQIDAKKIPAYLTQKEKKVELKKLVEKKPAVKFSADGYRDFRYGVPFIWDYEGFGPELRNTINIITKTPEFFYPIKDRDISKGEEEAHMQLSINLYRKKKYGLMYKSIELFNQKYSESKLGSLNEYLKVNAILRNHIRAGNREPLKMAINMLRSLAENAAEYEQSKAVIKYLISYYVKNKEFVEVLKQAKRFYVLSKENYDYEESAYAAEAIFYSLSMMNQVERVEEVLKEKTIAKLLSKQLQLAYRIFVSHRYGDMKRVIRYYEKNRKNLVGKIYPSILFNVGEAYFRTGNFDKSISMFDKFLSYYSYLKKSDEARLRLALSYEIMNKDKKQTMLLYRNTINRSTNAEVSREAKFRYTSLRSVRKLQPNKEDLETRIFLTIPPKVDLSANLKKVLWIVRLRTFINDKKYRDAMRYLNAIPLTSLKPSERRMFEADGSEIVYGIIHDHYKKGEYSNIVKIWNMYKEKFVVRVANDPYINFVVGQSYLKLGLYKGFEKLYARFKKLNNQPIKTYPYWVERIELGNKTAILKELSIIKNIKLSNWDLANRNIELLAEQDAQDKYNYYKGIVEFQKNNYNAAIKSFENFLSSQRKDIELDPQDLANLIRYYTDSIYEIGDLEKYKEVSEAILSDTDSLKNDNLFMKDVRERLEYMNIEILAGKADSQSYLIVEKKISDFLKKYEKPKNYGRIRYLLGHSYVKNMKYDEGKAVLEEILLDENISNHIKELAKSELSLITIKKRTL